MTKSSQSDASGERKTLLDRFLSIFADTRAHEGAGAAMLAIGIFLLLTSYYLLKVSREPLILEGGGAEVKSYSSAGQALLLVPLTFAFGKLASRVGRLKLITIVGLFFATNIVAFALALGIGLPIAIPFFLWVGIFNTMMVAIFWSFAADVYDEEQGKRLFVIVGIGSTLGAAAGSGLARGLIRPIGITGMLFLAAVLLVASLGLVRLVHAREGRRAKADDKKKEEPLSAKGGFALLVRDRYLLLIAGFIFLLNCINTNGEYILDRALLSHVKDILPAGADPHQFGEQYVGQFKATYFLIINSATVVLQLFGVSRVIKYIGVRKALFIAPVISLVGYSSMLVVPVIGVIFAGKIAENTLDYSLQNTVKQTLWLPTDRVAKYKAKTVIDSLIVRVGDLLSAAITAGGAALHFATRNFIAVNAGLVIAWLGVVTLLARQHAKLEGRSESDAKSDESNKSDRPPPRPSPSYAT